MNKYNNGKIYKIIDNTNNNIYIGSTIQDLNKRLNHHKCCYNKKNNNSVNIIIKNNDYKIELIENYSCNNKKELLEREGHYIRNTEYCINKVQPGIDRKETIKKSNEKRKEEIKNWHYENKEKVKEYKKKYENKKLRLIKVKCDCGLLIAKCNLNRHKKSKKHINFLNTYNTICQDGSIS